MYRIKRTKTVSKRRFNSEHTQLYTSTFPKISLEKGEMLILPPPHNLTYRHSPLTNTSDFLTLARTAVAVAVLSCCALCTFAQRKPARAAQQPNTVSITVLDTVDYRKQMVTGAANITFRKGESQIDPLFEDNVVKLNQIAHAILQIRKERSAVITNIHLAAYASPEGTAAHNQLLSSQRANALKDYIQEAYGIEPELITATGMGENWADMEVLVAADRSSTLAPYKQSILNIIRTVDIYDVREMQLMKLNNGAVYRYLANRYFPALRKTAYSIHWEYDSLGINRRQMQVEEQRVQRVQNEGIAQTVNDTVHHRYTVHRRPPQAFHPYWSLRTNLLYTAALLPNLAVEYHFAPHWSAALEGYYSWWQTNDVNFWSHRVQVGGAELRYWLTADRSRMRSGGHHFGAYFMGGTYDMRLFPADIYDLGYLSDWSYSAGITYGYRFDFNARWGLELGLGIGYFGGIYKTYYCINCEVNTIHRHYFGPTRAAVSLVYHIGKEK